MKKDVITKEKVLLKLKRLIVISFESENSLYDEIICAFEDFEAEEAEECGTNEVLFSDEKNSW